jgi:hypothetical protein
MHYNTLNPYYGVVFATLCSEKKIADRSFFRTQKEKKGAKSLFRV